MVCSRRRGSKTPILIGGGPCATVSARPGMAVREATRRVTVGNANPCPTEPQVAVGGLSGMHVVTGRFSKLWRRTRCSKLCVGDDAACRGILTGRNGQRRTALVPPQSSHGEGRVGARSAGSISIAAGPAQLEGPTTSGAGGGAQGPWPWSGQNLGNHNGHGPGACSAQTGAGATGASPTRQQPP